jgi:hypothetical protein
MNATRLLYATAVVLGVGGAALRLVPLERLRIADRPPGAPRMAAAGPISLARATGGTGPTSSDPIVSANIFSRSRTAPAREAAVVHATHSPASLVPHGAALTLYGTTIGPQGAVALIDDDTPPRGAHLHRMGDLIAGARLVAITDSTVTLDRQSGPLVLHLPASMRQTP